MVEAWGGIFVVHLWGWLQSCWLLGNDAIHQARPSNTNTQ